MRISVFHNELRQQGRVPVEKVGHNKGIRRAWRADRRTNAETKALADAAEALAWEKEMALIDATARDRNNIANTRTERLLRDIFAND